MHQVPAGVKYFEILDEENIQKFSPGYNCKFYPYFDILPVFFQYYQFHIYELCSYEV